MGLQRLADTGACFVWPRWNEPLQEARDYHVVSGAPQPGIGPWGPYLGFDGANDYITLGGSYEDLLRFDEGTADFSVVAWVRRAATGTSHRIISKADGVGDGWVFGFASSNAVRMFINGPFADGPATVTDTDWHCVVVVVDRSASVTVYLDGVPGTPLVIAGPVMATTTAPRIGADSHGAAASKFNGAIASIAVFPRVLGAEEALGLASSSGPF